MSDSVRRELERLFIVTVPVDVIAWARTVTSAQRSGTATVIVLKMADGSRKLTEVIVK